MSDKYARILGLAGLGVGAYALSEARKKPVIQAKNYVLKHYRSYNISASNYILSDIIYTDVMQGDKLFLEVSTPTLATGDEFEIYFLTRDMPKQTGVSYYDWWDMNKLIDMNTDTYINLPDLTEEVIPWTLDLGEPKIIFYYWDWIRATEEYNGAYPYLEFSIDGTTWTELYTSDIAFTRTRYVRVRIPASSDWPVTKDNVFVRELEIIIPDRLVTEKILLEYDYVSHALLTKEFSTYIPRPAIAFASLNPLGESYSSLVYDLALFREFSKLDRPPKIEIMTGRTGGVS